MATAATATTTTPTGRRAAYFLYKEHTYPPVFSPSARHEFCLGRASMAKLLDGSLLDLPPDSLQRIFSLLNDEPRIIVCLLEVHSTMRGRIRNLSLNLSPDNFSDRYLSPEELLAASSLRWFHVIGLGFYYPHDEEGLNSDAEVVDSDAESADDDQVLDTYIHVAQDPDPDRNPDLTLTLTVTITRILNLRKHSLKKLASCPSWSKP